ncbi:MAG: hypothetical protein M0Z48_00515 [Nitrospiraceae bacterium]|nr:hypothetical protein [Nitrospiraceae bacterium]
MNLFSEIKLGMETTELYGLTKEAMMKNWRTTLTGLFGALAIAAHAYLSQHGINAADVIQMLISAGLGYFAADGHAK